MCYNFDEQYIKIKKLEILKLKKELGREKKRGEGGEKKGREKKGRGRGGGGRKK